MATVNCSTRDARSCSILVAGSQQAAFHSTPAVSMGRGEFAVLSQLCWKGSGWLALRSCHLIWAACRSTQLTADATSYLHSAMCTAVTLLC